MVIVLDGRFRFTIITAFYNTGDYLKESIESIINQDIGFKDHVQYILVDDGSTDHSKEIALNYQQLYPENILVLSKENGGPASARNLALKYVEGEFVNCLDSDDLLSSNALSVVSDFISKNNVDIVAIPIIYFGKKEGDHHLNYKFEEDQVVDIEEKFNYSQASMSSAFINAGLLEGKQFNTDLVNGEDLLLLNKLLIDLKKYGVTNKAQYLYRKRFESSSIMDSSRYSKKFFLEKMQLCYKELIDYSIAKEGYVSKYIQYLIALDLNAIITSPFFEEAYSDGVGLDEFWDCLYDILSYIDENIIRKHDYLSYNVKSFYIYLKNNDFHVDINRRGNKVFLKSNDYVINRLHNHNIYFDIVEIRDNKLCLAGCIISRSKSSSMHVQAVIKFVDGSKEVYDCRYVDYPNTNRDVRKFLGIPWKYYYDLEVEIPITDKSFKVTFELLFEENGENAILNPGIQLFPRCNISEFSNYAVYESKMVLLKDEAFHVVENSTIFRHKLELQSIFSILKSSEEFKFYSIFIRIISAFAYIFFRNKRIWLFMDRPIVADDNAKHLFSYSVNQNDNIKKYYVVDKDTRYFDEMLKVDKNIVPWGSLKHKILYLYAEKIISSHVNHDWLNPFYEYNPILYKGLTTIKTCFLQHGVIKDDLSNWLKKFHHNFYLFLTSSDYERNSIINGNYRYSENVVQALGLPRYDNLKKSDSVKQILFMPTWRKYLKDKGTFKNSKFYEYLDNFFNNEKLLKLLNDYNYKIVFKPHFDLMPFLDILNIPDEITVSIDESYQELFNTSSLLITDYSSVFFDFSYLKKPVIYYRGEDEYHYEQGYFDFETMGFGDIITSEEVLIDKIKEYIENDFEMEDEYKMRVDDFFKFTDQNNSKRVYEWLLNHKG